MFQFHLLVFHFPSVSLPPFDPHLFEGVVVAAVVVQLLVEIVDDLVAGHIQEFPCVGDYDHRGLAVADVVLEPHHSIEI